MALQAQGLPLFVVDAGDLGWKSASIAPTLAGQQLEKFELQLQAYALGGIDGWTPGEGDLALGHERLQAAVQRHGTPALAANLRCEGEEIFPAGRVVERGGVRLGLVGLVEPTLLGAAGIGGCIAEPTLPAAKAAIDALGPVDAVVVLSHMSAAAEAELAPALGRPVLFVNGHERKSTPQAAALGSGSVRLASGSRGKELGFAEVHFQAGASGFQAEAGADDARKIERFTGRQQIARTKLDAAAPGSAEATQAQKQVDFYQAEIDAARKRLQAASTDQGPRHALSVQIVDLGKDVADHAATLSLVESAKTRIAAADAQAGPTAPASLGDSAWKGSVWGGSASCLSCHPTQHAQWASTPHASAWTRLVQVNRQSDQACFSCHVTGAFAEGAPATASAVPAELHAVGCEACHGPGAAHSADPAAGAIVRDPPVEVCQQCHDGKMDEGRFDLQTYRPRVLHGPAAEPAP